MKRLCFFVVICCYTVSLFAQAELVRNLQEGKEQRLVIYGTSITKMGSGPLWVAQLDCVLNEKYDNKLQLFNKGGSGRNSQWGLENLQDSVLASEPNTVIIEFSINDAVQKEGYSNLTVAQAKSNTEEIFRRLRQQNPDVEIILLIVSTHPLGEGLEKRPALAGYLQSYRDLAAQYGLLLIDFQPVWDAMIAEKGVKAMQRYLPDGIHPSRSGALQMIAPRILEGLGIN